MKSYARAAFPVRRLREQVTELEAAVLLVLNKPGKKAVHRIRTASRRIEAQLELLDAMTPGEARLRSLRGYGKAEKGVKKHLRRLRKAAGKVRDADVQRVLLFDTAHQTRNPKMRQQAEHLRRVLKQQRRDRAESLQSGVKAHRAKLTPRLEALLDVLEPVEDLPVTEMQLLRVTREWFSARTGEIAAANADNGELHATRKSAKLARYMAESGGDGLDRVAQLARRFEAMQQAGGRWHDLLALRALASADIGERSALVRRFSQQEKTACAAFRQQFPF